MATAALTIRNLSQLKSFYLVWPQNRIFQTPSDHQPDDFSWGEMVAGGLIGQFIESADEILKDQSHLLVWHGGRVQSNVAELGDDGAKDVRLAHFFDLGFAILPAVISSSPVAVRAHAPGSSAAHACPGRRFTR
jgi:hypothetical protein